MRRRILSQVAFAFLALTGCGGSSSSPAPTLTRMTPTSGAIEWTLYEPPLPGSQGYSVTEVTFSNVYSNGVARISDTNIEVTTRNLDGELQPGTYPVTVKINGKEVQQTNPPLTFTVLPTYTQTDPQ